jgi:cytochrome c oxidase cbb3-type subunit 4
MRYLKHYFESIAGIDIYPIISLLIFFIFFVGLTFYVIYMRKPHVEYMRNRPLDDNLPENPQS